MIDGKLLDTAWQLGAEAGVYLLSRSVHSALGGKTPYQRLSQLLGDSDEGHKPDISHLRGLRV